MHVALMILLGSGATACGGDQGGGMTVDGAPLEIADPSDRGAAVELTGTTLQGETFDLAAARGRVTVVNVWGSWCGDCVREAGYLRDAHAKLGDAVPFVGIDVKDTSRSSAIAFERGNRITYPSIYSPDGRAVLAFAGVLAPRTTPATLVLDTSGRVAAVIPGTIPSTLTLVEVVRDIQAANTATPSTQPNS